MTNFDRHGDSYNLRPGFGYLDQEPSTASPWVLGVVAAALIFMMVAFGIAGIGGPKGAPPLSPPLADQSAPATPLPGPTQAP